MRRTTLRDRIEPRTLQRGKIESDHHTDDASAQSSALPLAHTDSSLELEVNELSVVEHPERDDHPKLKRANDRCDCGISQEPVPGTECNVIERKKHDQ